MVNHISWVAVVTPTNRPNSVRSHRVIELFGGVFVLSLCTFHISVGIRAFVIGLRQISSIFLCLKDKWCSIQVDYLLMYYYTE